MGQARGECGSARNGNIKRHQFLRQLIFSGGGIMSVRRRWDWFNGRHAACAASALLISLLSGMASADDPLVIVNGVTLTGEETARIERMISARLVAGRYWYDRMAGLWGYEGGPTAGFAIAGLDLGGKLRADASRGGTGVFFNERELHPVEVQYLRTLGPVLPGRYWLNAAGYVGYTGQTMAFAHLPSLHAMRYGSNASTTPGGAYIANGGGCMYISAKSSSGVGTWGASTC
jgi:hypothetical protein